MSIPKHCAKNADDLPGQTHVFEDTGNTMEVFATHCYRIDMLGTCVRLVFVTKRPTNVDAIVMTPVIEVVLPIEALELFADQIKGAIPGEIDRRRAERHRVVEVEPLPDDAPRH
jgi:hypothetical protein